MGKITGFLEFYRLDRGTLPPADRIRNNREFVLPLPKRELRDQASRCMDCGIPYCHPACPVNNQIPDWNDLIYRGKWREALRNLLSTNNFPEFTGRICPAPCEAACTLNLIDAAVTIKTIECAIVDRGWREGWITPELPRGKTGKRVAIVGSGPAGLACAQQLARIGHEVHVFEKHTRPGGLLRYGIPDFKLEKRHIDRRMEQMQVEGVIFHCNVHVGRTLSAEMLRSSHDALVLAGGTEQPRDLPIKGRELAGIHFAMDFLTQQNKRVSGEEAQFDEPIVATDKHVVIIGGGDTGSDCIGTSIRQSALSVTQLEIMPMPPRKEDKLLTWPNWPLILRTSSSHQEGGERQFAVMTTRFSGRNSKANWLHCVRVDAELRPIPNTEFELQADLVLLAAGFVGPVREGALEEWPIDFDMRGNVVANSLNYQTSIEKVFAAGDMRRGQSLVVWAIREGRQAARSVDEYLNGSSVLPR
jgi:glutamate synthase (NADPH/NADH) small chain